MDRKALSAEEMAARLHPVETQRASAAIYEQIKGLILSGDLKPGDRLPSERSLMSALQRSRPTIREALRMLEHAGLIQSLHGGGGAVVREPGTVEAEESLMVMLRTSRVTVAELAEYRLASEAAMVRWAAQRRTAEDLDALDALLSDARKQLEAREFEGFLDHDTPFHRALAKAGGNTVAAMMSELLSRLSLPKTLETLRDQTPEERLFMCSRVLDMHREILERVREGDGDAAAEAMTRHMRAFGADVKERD